MPSALTWRCGERAFWPDLVRACAEAGTDYADDVVLRAIWDLVWGGEITNDSLAPVRSMLTAPHHEVSWSSKDQADDRDPGGRAQPDRPPLPAVGR